MRIEFDNISQRILVLPMPPRRYVSLQVGKAGVLCAVEAIMAELEKNPVPRPKYPLAAGCIRRFKTSCKLLKMVARDGIGPPTLVDNTQLTVLSSPQIVQIRQISIFLAQI